jgi:transglutaminase-like putative cysteine protease
VVLIWLGALAWLVIREYGASPDGESATTQQVPLPPTTAFYALDAGLEQVGLYSLTTDTLADGLRVTARTDVDVPLPLVARRLLTNVEAVYDRRFHLRSFTTAASGEAGQVTLSGSIADDTLLTVVATGRGFTASDTVFLAVPAGVLLPDAVPLGLASRGGLKTGAVTVLHVLDPVDLSVQPWEIRVGAESTFVVADSAVVDLSSGAWVPAGLSSERAWRVTWTEHGLPVRTWIDRQGEVIDRTTPLGLRHRRGPFEIVNSRYVRRRPRNVQAAPLEVAVPVTTPEGVNGVALGVGDLRAVASALATPWQAVVQDAIETRRGPVPPLGAAPPIPDSIPAADREPPVSDRIRLDARRIAGADTAAPARAVGHLTAWIASAVVPGSPDFGGVEQTLLRRQGDSSDRALLLVEMARALGIPARPVAGLLSSGGRLRYRAWTEVWVGTWMPADPTLGQFPADGGHIRLLTHATARPAAIVSLVGALRPTLANPATVP